jgi:hypothetical protein
MPSTGSLFVRLGLQNKQFVRGMRDSQRHIKTMGRSITTLKRIAVAGFAGWGINKIVQSFVDAAVESEGFRVRLNALLGSVEEGNKLFKDMADFAGQVPFEYKEIMASATQLAGVMRGGTEEIKQWMPIIADLAAVSGLSIQETTGQIVRMYSAGAAAADMFRERGITAMLGFQAGVSVSAEETRKRVIEAWEATDSKFRGVTTELSKTWSGTMSMFHDMWFQFRNMVMDSGPFQAMKEQAQNLLGAIQRLKNEGALEEWARSVGAAVIETMVSIAEAVKLVYEAFKALQWGVARVMEVWQEFKAGTNLEGAEEAINTLREKGLKLAKEQLDGWQGAVSAIGDQIERIQTATEKMRIWRDIQTETADEFERINGVLERIIGGLQIAGQSASKVKDAVGVSGGGRVGETDLGSLATDTAKRKEVLSETMKNIREFNEREKELRLEQKEFKENLLDDEIERLRNFQTTKAELLEWAGEHEIEISRHVLQTIEAIEKAKQKRIEQSIKTSLGNFAYFFRVASEYNKSFFVAYKAFAIAEAIVATFLAATKAMAEVPYPYNFVAAASVIAFGLAQVAQIASQSIGGGVSGGTVGGGAVGTFPASPATGLPTSFGGDSDEERGQVIINIYGDSINDEEYLERWAEKISEMVEDKDVRLVTSHAKFAEQLG